MYKEEILALKDIGEGLLITSGGSEFQMAYLWLKLIVEHLLSMHL